MTDHDEHDDPTPVAAQPHPLAQTLIDNPALIPHLLNWVEDSTPTPDASLDDGVRLIIWKMGSAFKDQNPAAYLHFMELAQGREPDITRTDAATLRNLIAAVYACAVAMSNSDPAFYGVTLPERNLACVVLADEVARLRLRITELMPPPVPAPSTIQ